MNAQVAEKERKLRLIEIYNKIDAKSATTYRNKKFKKSDLLSSTRRLMFEGVAYLNHARGKVQLVTVVVLSDVVFFLQESNQKFHFVTQDNKVRIFFLTGLGRWTTPAKVIKMPVDHRSRPVKKIILLIFFFFLIIRLE